LIPPLSTPENESALLLFFQYLDVQDTASGHTVSSCLPQNISTTEEDALYLAVSSIGYARLSKLTNSPERLATARQKYGRAVRKTYNFIETATVFETCAVIRVILILAMFEVDQAKLDLLSLIQAVTHERRTTFFHTLVNPSRRSRDSARLSKNTNDKVCFGRERTEVVSSSQKSTRKYFTIEELG
jgi:hypothetical protein